MLAGLPKAPGTNNPVANPRRAQARQLLRDRPHAASPASSAPSRPTQAQGEPLHLRDAADPNRLHAEYVAETVRQQMVAQYGDSTYTRGLKVYTTLVAERAGGRVPCAARGHPRLRAAPALARPGGLRRPAGRPAGSSTRRSTTRWPSTPTAAICWRPWCSRPSAKEIVAVRADGETITVTGEGLQPVQPALSAQGAGGAANRPRRGDPRGEGERGNGRLGDHPVARSRGRLRGARSARRRGARAGRRLRLRQAASSTT